MRQTALHTLVLASHITSLIIATGFHGLPTAHAQSSSGGTCTSVDIQLPHVLVLRGTHGDIRARVETNLSPGIYTIRYVPRQRQFEVAPWTDTETIINVSLDGSKAQGKRYQAYVDSTKAGVPLIVSCISCASTSSQTVKLTSLNKERANALMLSVGADPDDQAMAKELSLLATDQTLSASNVRQALNTRNKRLGITGAPSLTGREVVFDSARKKQWDALDTWEKDLWNQYLKAHPDAVDMTRSPDELHASEGVRFSMALSISYRYMGEGIRDAAKELFTDSTFVTTTMVAIMAYLALWVAPEPIFTKVSALISTVGLVAVAGFAATEVISLARAIFRLSRDTRKARNLRAIERAAERFGKSFGASSLRLLLALALIKGGTKLPRPPSVPATTTSMGTLALAGAHGGTVAVPRSAAQIKVLADGTVQLILGGMAMATMTGSDGSSGADDDSESDTRPPPGKWKTVNETMSDRAAAYQRQITGRPATESYVVRGTRFDGYKNGVLQDAKGPGYENFITAEGKFKSWFQKKGRTELIEQANRQSRVAQGIPIEWHIAEPRLIPLLRKLFNDKTIKGIQLIHTPPIP